MSLPQVVRRAEVPSFGHLQVMTGPKGLFEHALYSRPREEHGYSLDDNGRALVAICRAKSAGVDVPKEIGNRWLRFVLRAGGGGWTDRQSADGQWNAVASDDAVGRALWGLGAVAGHWHSFDQRKRARSLLLRSRLESRHWRPHAYAILGLTSLHRVDPFPDTLERIRYHASQLPNPLWTSPSWPWPEKALTYDNARLPEAMMSAGAALGEETMTEEGVALLGWLVDQELASDHFSFTPVGGRREGDPKPGFDQQPLEAWAMADAACRAAWLVDDPSWFGWAELAVSWFTGNNDTGHSLYDSVSGGCSDGLTATGPNLNRGAESTVSAMAAWLALLMDGEGP